MRLNRWAGISFTILVTSWQTFASQAGPDPDRIQRGLLTDIRPSSIEEMTKGSDVVVRARLVKARTFLRNEIYIITDYEITNPQVISGAFALITSPNPGVRSSLVLGVFGGEVTINGQTIKAENHAMAADITSGREYLLFLRKFGTDPGRYQLHNGGIFEIDRHHAKALARGAETVFKGTSQAAVADLIDRVRGHGKTK